jgi:CHASE2 domain-containing sensor protein
MNAAHLSHYKYQPGGSLPPDAPTYIMREADTQLYNALLAGEYCYVLNSRQMGKSSLRIHTMFQLQSQGFACAEIELSGIGSQQITAQQWYGGIIQELISGFALKVNRRSWLKEQNDLSPVQCLGEFIETVLLQQIEKNIVIFIDEIDSVLSLNFAIDDFFALIRNCYDKRASKPEYRRLTFVLLGVATPSDLIKGEFATPFNIGTAIELKGFQFHESRELVQGLIGKVSDLATALQEILYWTGGQPFLTQKLCWLITQQVEILTPESIARLVQEKIITNWESQDQPEHLRTIQDRILRNSLASDRLLKIYQQILKRGKIRANNSQDHLELRLSGLVSLQEGNLVVKNPIYQAVFDQNWVKQHLQIDASLPVSLSWKTVAVASVLASLFVIGIRSLGFLQAWELQAYDQLMQLRPQEPKDERLLLVTITEADVQSQPIQERGAASISEASLIKLLDKLESGQPRAIGLDIYREAPANPELANKLKNSDRFFAICKYGQPGVSPPPELKSDYQGFNNVISDIDDVLRRHILAVSNTSPCESFFAFSWQLATHYLLTHNITTEVSPDDYLQLGQTVFQTLEKNSGVYHNINYSGHQILLNYRAAKPLAETVTLQAILSPEFDSNLVKDRIVIIGTTAPSFNDHRWRTPLGNLSGLEIQAHMVSQILSAVLNNRPLIWWLPKPGEFIWIGFWSFIASLLTWRFQSGLKILLSTGITITVLYGSCWMVFVFSGGWLPLVPAILTVVITNSSLGIYAFHKKPFD